MGWIEMPNLLCYCVCLVVEDLLECIGISVSVWQLGVAFVPLYDIFFRV